MSRNELPRHSTCGPGKSLTPVRDGRNSDAGGKGAGFGAGPEAHRARTERNSVLFASLKPEAVFKIGELADWVQITDDAVWVASSKPASVHRIDPKTNKEVAIVPMPGDPCAGLAFGFGSHA